MNRSFRLLFITLHLLIYFESSASDLTWEDLKEKQFGTVDIYYRNSAPFLVQNEDGTLSGLEYEMLVGFQRFMLNKYGYKLDYNWIEKNSFNDIYNFISNDSNLGDFGLDITSYTEKRAKEVQFSFPYFPDIQVLVSHKSTPVVKSIDEFNKFFNGSVAFSSKQTTYETNLKKIRQQNTIDFEIVYLESSNDIIDQIIETQGSFGYIDLPNYLMSLSEDKVIKRQNVLPKKGKGYSVIFNLKSDWHIPFDQYLISPEFEIIKNNGVQKHLGYDVSMLINNMSNNENEEIVLLQKEKSFINQELFQKEREAQKNAFVRNMLISGLILLIIIAYIFFSSNRSKARANDILMKHREKIEDQNTLLSKHNEELVLKDEEKNNFIHILSHDLRSPINNITGLADILKMDEEDLNADQLRMIGHIAAESQRLNKMVTRILDIEKIESKSPEEFSEIKLNEILARVIDNYESQAAHKSIQLEKSIAKNLVVLGDEQYLFHVFENLVSNAIKFSPPNKKVYIDAKTLDLLVEVRIKDEGPGMSEEDQQNMFKKFQVLSAKATAGERSTGLGLSIVDKYIGLLGGELECESTTGKGSTFIVKLSMPTRKTL